MPGSCRRLPGLAVRNCSARRSVEAVAGFWLLFVIGVLDTGVRMGLLTFLPFLLKSKGASLPTVGVALAMVFFGGAAGKFVCGWLGACAGVLLTVLATEDGSAACIVGVLVPWPCRALWGARHMVGGAFPNRYDSAAGLYGGWTRDMGGEVGKNWGRW